MVEFWFCFCQFPVIGGGGGGGLYQFSVLFDMYSMSLQATKRIFIFFILFFLQCVVYAPLHCKHVVTIVHVSSWISKLNTK